MPTHTKFRGANGAAVVFGLAAAALIFDSCADPIPAESMPETAVFALPTPQPLGNDLLADPAKRPEFLPVLPAIHPVNPILEFGEFVYGDFARPRRPGLKPAPNNRQSVPAHEPGLEGGNPLNPVFRRFVDVNSDQPGAAGPDRERGRRDRARESNPDGPELIWTAENQIKDAIINAIGEGAAALSQAGYADFSVSLRGDRRTVNYDGIELFSLLRYDAGNDRQPPPAQAVRSANAQAPHEVDRNYGPAAASGLSLTGLIREFLTDPVTLAVALSLLVIWKVSESTVGRKQD